MRLIAFLLSQKVLIFSFHVRLMLKENFDECISYYYYWFEVKDMNLGIITPNIFFGESLESLLENCDITKDRYEIIKKVLARILQSLM